MGFCILGVCLEIKGAFVAQFDGACRRLDPEKAPSFFSLAVAELGVLAVLAVVELWKAESTECSTDLEVVPLTPKQHNSGLVVYSLRISSW